MTGQQTESAVRADSRRIFSLDDVRDLVGQDVAFSYQSNSGCTYVEGKIGFKLGRIGQMPSKSEIEQGLSEIRISEWIAPNGVHISWNIPVDSLGQNRLIISKAAPDEIEGLVLSHQFT